ncbi:hypothetical protein ACGFX2_33035 [Streptomyces goshikiensis]|uniref:golvesin C-terminal-like domain-containing protein n=1 Tax=Streptomyces goshikiensis TaxID=1942 RepID=UPI0037131657
MAFTTFAGGTHANAGERETAALADAPAGSQDRAWTTTGDADGFHVMVADAKDGYGWRTAASLSEPGFDTDTWIGNACVTGSGQRAVVVYAPRTFTNKPQLMARGGFTAIVDLASGGVTKLGLQASLSYYNPGCGVDETAILTQSPGEDKTSTRLVRVDATTGALAPPVETRGQVTSAVPVKDGGIVATDGGALVRIEPDGASTRLATARGVPFRLTADKDGGVVFLDKIASPGAESTTPAPERAAVERVTASQIRRPEPRKTKPTELAAGPLTETGLARDAAGTVYVTGPVRQSSGKLPDVTRLLPTTLKDAKVGTRGESILTRTAWADGKDTRIDPDEAVAARPVSIDLTVRATGRTASAVVDPAAKPGPNIGQGKDRSPTLPSPHNAPGGARALSDPRPPGSSTQIVEAERTCAVPRNDPRNQAMQPRPRQVEWAVDQAIVGNLDNKVSRPANWKNLGMPAYQPQAMFPLQALSGGGSRVPAQVMLGVTAQESNMWQASRTTVPGVTGNPLIGNYYGINYYDGNSANDWDVDWSKADCGYGITQVTDHMRLAGREDGKLPAWDYQQQRAVALDYTANIAAGLQILTEKWNVTHDNGLIVNNGNATKIENWYFALWAFNSGFYPNPGDGSAWGVGWANNPANPEWDAGRLPFLEKGDGSDSYPDAAHPQDWPYQEKVIGWAGHPLEGLESPGKMVAGYRQAWWNGRDGDAYTVGNAKYYRAQAKPPEGLFCAPENSCDATKITDGASNDPGVGPCTRADHKCWWNKPVTYKPDCDYSCGNDLVRFNTTYAEEADGTTYPPACTLNGLPAGALVVDDLPDDVPSIRPNCEHPWNNAGTFTMSFGNDPNATEFPAKVDTHQLGAGFGGHFYFAHSRKDDAKGQQLKVTGTWKLNQAVAEQAMVMVHIPDHGAQTKYATYEVKTNRGTVKKTIDQTQGSGNRWVKLGVLNFGNAAPEIRLNNVTPDGNGEVDVAFDAAAFIPGNYSDLSKVTFPGHANTPELGYLDDDEPQPIPGMLPSSLRQSTPPENCGEKNPETLTRMCMQVEGQPDAQNERAAVSAAAAGLVPRCNTGTASTLRRFDACLNVVVRLTYLKDNTPPVIVRWDVRQQIKTYADQGYFDQELTLTPRIDGPPVPVTTTIDPKLLCESNTGIGANTCASGPVTLDGSWTWQPGVIRGATAKARHTWVAGSEGRTDFMTLKWEFPATAPSYTPGTTGSWSNAQWTIRCDNTFWEKIPGCVFHKYIPEVDLETRQSPAAGAMYWLLMKKLQNHPGSKDFKKPLRREADKAEIEANRRNICPTDGPEQYAPHPDADPGTTRGINCDEYPFAASKEGGGGNPRPSSFPGNDCVQMYAVQVAGLWVLEEDDRYWLPGTNSDGTWQAKCGRASMPGDQNQNIASPLGLRKFPAARVQNGDEFYVGTPGFEHCIPDLPCQADWTS